jgi:hypothetical protein
VFAVALAATALVRGGTAAAAPRHIAIVQDIVHDGNAPAGRRDAFLDTAFYGVWPRQHLTVMLGSFATGVEWGGFLRDRRGSSYGLGIRRRTGGFVADTAVDLDTQQRFRNFVAGASARLFWADRPEYGNLLVVPQAGLQAYYQDASYVALTVTYDPRPATGTTFRFTNRTVAGAFAFDVAVAPRTDGVVHWALGGRWRCFSLGYGRERDFDFTRLDRRVFSFGFRWDLPAD